MTLLLLALLGCSTDTTPTASAAVAASLRTAPVESVTWRPRDELTGSVEPIAAVQLGFDVPGRIETLYVHRGDTVKAGQSVARLDARMASSQVTQAQAALAGAEAQLAAGEASFARAQKLREAGAMSEQQYSDAEGGILAARAGLAQARAAVSLARTYLDNHTLRSPIAGIVSNGPDNAGVMVGAGTPMFLIEDLSTLQIKGAAPEADTWIQAGMAADVVAGPPGAETHTPATVARVLPALDPMTRRLPVEVVIHDPPPTLRAHSFARVVLTAATEEPALQVPRGAVVARPDFSVFTVAGPGAPPIRVPVTVLDDHGPSTVVRGALMAGDNVVLDPPHSLSGNNKSEK